MALLLCSAVTCQIPALPDGEIRPSEAKREMKNESLPRFSLYYLCLLTTAPDLYLIEGLTMETRVVQKGQRGFRKRPLLPIWRTPAAAGSGAAPVRAFDPPQIDLS